MMELPQSVFYYHASDFLPRLEECLRHFKRLVRVFCVFLVHSTFAFTTHPLLIPLPLMITLYFRLICFVYRHTSVF